MHSERNPYFGGVNPEPIPPNIDEFLARVPAEGADVGLVVNPDLPRPERNQLERVVDCGAYRGNAG